MRRRPGQAQTEVLAFILAEEEAGRGFPTDVAIAKHMGYRSTSSATDVLRGLDSKGLLGEADDHHRCPTCGQILPKPMNN